MAYMTDIQQAAQAALPVIPNNGNPNGAYNMASADPSGPLGPGMAPTQPGPKSNDPLSWVQPSEYMTDIKHLLQAQTEQLLIQHNESKQLFNYVPRGNGLYTQDVDDNGIPVNRYGGTVGDEAPVIPGMNLIPQYSPANGPVLPSPGISQ